MNRYLKAILWGLLIAAIGLLASPFRITLNLEENAGLGLLFKLRGPNPAPPDAVVVSIDRDSSESLHLPDNPDKWPRSLHARLTENLIREGARLVAFDLHFIEPRSERDDDLFADAMKKAGNVILSEPIREKDISLPETDAELDHNIVKLVPPIDLFASAAAATAPFTLPRIPFKVNKYWKFEAGAGDSPTIPVLACQLFDMPLYGRFVHLIEKAGPSGAIRLPAADSLKNFGLKDLVAAIREIFERNPLIASRMLDELDRSGGLYSNEEIRKIRSLIKLYSAPDSRYINFYGPPGTITTIPYYKALQLHGSKIGDRHVDLKGKAVFVGLSEVALAERKDSFYTVFSRANGTFIGGVEIMATAFTNLLTDKCIKPVSLPYHALVILLWGLLIGAVCRLTHFGVAAVSVIGLSVLYLIVAVYQFRNSQTWYPVITPLFFQAPLAFVGAVLWDYVDISKEKKNIRKAFEHYLPKDVVDQLSKDVAHIKTGNRIVDGVCLFTDAQQYSDLSETLSPSELSGLMNRYYETMFKPVKRHEGFVSGVIGDSMLALWVSASSKNTLRGNACLAAIEICRDLGQFKQKSTDTVKIKTRIGLHYGQISLGNIGALDHYEYTPMGDIVNTASRIEGLNKYLGTNLLVSGEVMDQVEGFLTRGLGSFRLKGKKKPIVIHELICRMEEADEAKKSGCEIFSQALAAFKTKHWDEAGDKFEKVIEILGEDGASRFYRGLCDRYRENPPGDNWEGVIIMEEK